MEPNGKGRQRAGLRESPGRQSRAALGPSFRTATQPRQKAGIAGAADVLRSGCQSKIELEHRA